MGAIILATALGSLAVVDARVPVVAGATEVFYAAVRGERSVASLNHAQAKSGE